MELIIWFSIGIISILLCLPHVLFYNKRYERDVIRLLEYFIGIVMFLIGPFSIVFTFIYLICDCDRTDNLNGSIRYYKKLIINNLEFLPVITLLIVFII